MVTQVAMAAVMRVMATVPFQAPSSSLPPFLLLSVVEVTVIVATVGAVT